MTTEVLQIDKFRTQRELIGIQWRGKISPALGSTAIQLGLKDNPKYLLEKNELTRLMGTHDWADGGDPAQFEPGRAVRVVPQSETDGSPHNESTTQNVTGDNVISIKP